MLPTILAVDDDQNALERLETQLAGRYGRDYRVECMGRADQALQALDDAAQAGEEVALVLVSKSVWDAGHRDLLARTRQVHSHAKRGLIVPPGSWVNKPTAEAIRDAMAIGQIDYYVPTPSGAQDEVFHQAISSFLLEWATDRRMVPHTVHIVGDSWTGRAHELREVFELCAVPHTFCLADSDEGRELLSKAGCEGPELPLMVLPDGSVLEDPTNAQIAAAAGAPVDVEDDEFDVAIVGAGPAGLSAAVYGASEGLRTLVVDSGGIGGQARASSSIRNYLGFPKGVSGNWLSEQAFEQAAAFGASFLLMHRVAALHQRDERLDLELEDGRRITARIVILATGASYRRLNVPSLEAHYGAGVFYGGPAATAHALTGKQTYVVGGGNSAGQAALHLARYARQVTLLVRAESLDAGMSHYLVREIEATSNVGTLTETSVVGGGGEAHLENLVLRRDGREETVAADALFVLIGGRPHTDWVPAQLARDKQGFLLTGEEVADDEHWPLERAPLALETCMPRVLAVGDVRARSVKRVASAVGEGSIAIQLVHSLLRDAAPTLAPKG